MRMALLAIAGLALIGFLAVAVVLPEMAGAEAREAAQALIAGADQARQQVSSAVERLGGVAGAGKGVKIAPRQDPKYGDLKWIVSEDGSIRGWNEKNALEVTLKPTLRGGKASWDCKGYPVDAMPPTCGGRS